MENKTKYEHYYRGARKDTGEWVYGYLFEELPPLQCFAPQNPELSKWHIIISGFADWGMSRPMENFEIAPESIGKFIGLWDKTGRKIFSGDIIRYKHSENSTEYVGPIEYSNSHASFIIKTSDESGFSLLGQQKIIEIIGNVYSPVPVI